MMSYAIKSDKGAAHLKEQENNRIKLRTIIYVFQLLNCLIKGTNIQGILIVTVDVLW